MMNALRKKSFQTVLLLATFYLVIGIVFQGRQFWRLTAWAVSVVAYLGHIWYEHFRLHSDPRITAFHTSSAAAIASFGLAVAANIHAQFAPSSNLVMLALALVLWPLLTMLPAFGVAFIIASGLARWWRNR
jgi:hypothetical protein